MRWPIRNQILFPFAAVVLLVVAGTTLGAALLAARQQERQTLAQLERLVDTLGQASFPINSAVLDLMRGLSGAHFVAHDARGGTVAATLEIDPRLILPEAALAPLPAEELSGLSRRPALEIGNKRYLIARLERPLPGAVQTLYVLYPEARWTQARFDAALFPLSVGAAAMLLTLAVAGWLAHRLGARLRRLQTQVSAIAAGDFREIAVQNRDDELRDVEQGVNRMAERLRSLHSTLRRTEQERLLSQLAGGLAHSLRNAATGARLALQLHSRRCPIEGRDGSVAVALRQLALLETQVRGLLSLGRAETRPAAAVSLADLLREVESLVGPACEHGGVRLLVDVPHDELRAVCDPAALLAAVVNLALNAIEAAGRTGTVALRVSEAGTLPPGMGPGQEGAPAEGATQTANRPGGGGQATIEVSDTGPGPPSEIADRIFEPFVTAKPEGVGLGLALVRQIARDHGGGLDWFRRDGRTIFRLTLPAGGAAENQVRMGVPLSNIPLPTAP